MTENNGRNKMMLIELEEINMKFENIVHDKNLELRKP